MQKIEQRAFEVESKEGSRMWPIYDTEENDKVSIYTKPFFIFSEK